MFVYDKGLGGGEGLLCHICEPQGKYHSWKYKTMILRWREGLSYRSWKALAVLRFILVENGHKYLNIIYVSRLHHLFILQIVWVGWMSRTDNFPVMNQLSLTYLSLRPLLLRPQCCCVPNGFPHFWRTLPVSLALRCCFQLVLFVLPSCCLSTNLLTHFSDSLLLLPHHPLIVRLSLGDGSHHLGEQKLENAKFHCNGRRLGSYFQVSGGWDICLIEGFNI